MDLKGRAALITGGRRIGAAVAKALAAAGMDVGLSYNRSRAEAEAAAAEITAAGRRAHITSANLGNPDDCRALVNGTADAFGRLDVLVNMASVYIAAPFDETDEHGWNARHRRRPARRVPLRARGGPAHAARRRRTDHQLLRLGGRERASALHRLPAVLRRQGRRDRADRSAGARGRRRQHPRQRRRSRDPSSRRPETTDEELHAPSRPRRRSAAGAGPTRSSAP